MGDAPPLGPARDRDFDHLLGSRWRDRLTGAVFQLVIDAWAAHGCTFFRVDLDERLSDENREVGDADWLREHYEQVERKWVPVNRG